MQNPKPRFEQVWPEQDAGAERDPQGCAEDLIEPQELPVEDSRLRLVSDPCPIRTSRPRGSYYLRRGWSLIVKSVYLSRVLERLEEGYKDGGERFLSSLALVWVSNDGSRELALKGKALRELVLDIR